MTNAFTARSYREPSKILEMEATVQKILLVALQHDSLSLKMKGDSIAEGKYRGCTWCITDDGFACVLRITPPNSDYDSAIDVSRIEEIQTAMLV